MINTLALNLIADVMRWDNDQAMREDASLRLMLSVKYDGYSDFRSGVRLLESLANWLRQFTALLRAEGRPVNCKRVERTWRREGLKVPARQPKRERLG